MWYASYLLYKKCFSRSEGCIVIKLQSLVPVIYARWLLRVGNHAISITFNHIIHWTQVKMLLRLKKDMLILWHVCEGQVDSDLLIRWSYLSANPSTECRSIRRVPTQSCSKPSCNPTTEVFRSTKGMRNCERNSPRNADSAVRQGYCFLTAACQWYSTALRHYALWTIPRGAREPVGLLGGPCQAMPGGIWFKFVRNHQTHFNTNHW